MCHLLLIAPFLDSCGFILLRETGGPVVLRSICVGFLPQEVKERTPIFLSLCLESRLSGRLAGLKLQDRVG